MKKVFRIALSALVLFSFVFLGSASRVRAQDLTQEEILYLVELLLRAESLGVPVPTNVSPEKLVTDFMSRLEDTKRGPQTDTNVEIEQTPAENPVSEPAEDKPIDCFIPKGQPYRMNTCAGSATPIEFSLKVDWQPRVMTHIAGIGAVGFFLEVRVQITNMTDKTWNGLRGTSFSLIEDFSDSTARVTYGLDETVTAKKSKSYELNQLKDPVLPGQTLTYFLVFDISKQAVDQQTLVFRAVDYSDQKSETQIHLPLPEFIPVQYQ